jgi:hypothetical protein
VQDPLVLLDSETMSYVALAAFAAVDTITATNELPAPALSIGPTPSSRASHWQASYQPCPLQESAKASAGHEAMSVGFVLPHEELNLF